MNAINFFQFITAFSIISQQLMNIDFTRGYNIFHEHYVIPIEYNNAIDNILSNNSNCSLSKRLVVAPHRYIPDIGKHTYYAKPSDNIFDYNNLNYVVFEKKKLGKDNEITQYNVYCNFFVKYFEENALDIALKNIYSHDKNMVQSISIDASQFTISTFIVNRIYKPPTFVQALIVQNIFDHYKNTLSSQFLISGNRGVGKSYLAYVIKKEFDNKLNVDCKLFDDVNPTTIGLNIKSKILPIASEFSPVIIVINEFDIILEKVIQEKNFVGDPRSVHTQNKLTFNQLLDDIEMTQHVIAIYTTEKSALELKQNPLYKSYMRKGRIDYFVNMNSDNAEFIESDNL